MMNNSPTENFEQLVTVCTAARHPLASLALMWESFQFAHRKAVSWQVCEHDEDIQFYVTRLARRTLHLSSPNWQAGLDNLLRFVETKYVLILDSNIEFLNPIGFDMLEVAETTKSFFVGMSGYIGQTEKIAGQTLCNKHSIDPSCSLWRTDDLHRILKQVNFGIYIEPRSKYTTGTYHDVGQMVFQVSQLLGLKIQIMPSIANSLVRHDDNECAKMRLEALRNHKRSNDDLIWTGNGWQPSEKMLEAIL